MLHDHPTIRRIIYVIAVVAQVAAFFSPAAFPGAVELTDAFQQTANFLGGIAGLTALSNVPSKPPAD